MKVLYKLTCGPNQKGCALKIVHIFSSLPLHSFTFNLFSLSLLIQGGVVCVCVLLYIYTHRQTSKE